MNTKNIFAFLILVITGIFFYTFVWDFKVQAVDNVSEELSRLEGAYESATRQLSLKNLRLKKNQLGSQELTLLQNFIPQNLHSGYFVYNLGQLANLNRLSLTGLQYTVIDDTINNPTTGERKLQVELNVRGRYEDFINWVVAMERSNVLIDIDSINGTKEVNSGDIINFHVKLYAYGIKID